MSVAFNTGLGWPALGSIEKNKVIIPRIDQNNYDEVKENLRLKIMNCYLPFRASVTKLGNCVGGGSFDRS